MTLTTELITALRNEFDAQLSAQRANLSAQTIKRIGAVRREVLAVSDQVDDVRKQVHENHVESLRGFAHVGDELAVVRTDVAGMRELLEPVFEHHARHARRRARARRVLTSVPTMLTLAATIAGAAGAVVALF